MKKTGKASISSAASGLNPAKTRFALAEYGLDYAGPSPNNIEFFKAGKEIASSLADMPISVYSPGIVMHAGKGSKVLARVFQPYFNLRSWDRFHENLYVPPEKDGYIKVTVPEVKGYQLVVFE